MNNRPDHLPDFDEPPLNEVVLSVQFADLNVMSSIHAGLFWNRIRSTFDKSLEQPALAPVFEVFGGTERIFHHQTMLQLLPTAPMNRFWFINADETELIQIQRDRFVHNWRKVEGAKPYPRYEYIKKAFCDGIASFEGFLADEHLGRLVPNQCELSYINHIPLKRGEALNSELNRIFGEWFSPMKVSGSAFEDGDINLRLRLLKNSEIIGRLHVSIQPAVQVQGYPMVVMSLTARGRPFSADLEGCLAFTDFARNEIVERFASLTSTEMHRFWRRTK